MERGDSIESAQAKEPPSLLVWSPVKSALLSLNDKRKRRRRRRRRRS